MTVSATSSTTAATATSTDTTAAATSGALAGTQSEFLKLFMAQLQNQDPLDPQNGADMVAQLAQFSSVEQQTETNEKLTDLTSAAAAQSSASLSNLVGRTCTASADSISIASGATGSPPPLNISSDTPTVGATLTISDSNGKTVRTMTIPDGTTSTTLNWDGNTDAGTAAPAGDYTVSVNAGKSNAAISASWQGRVDGIQMTSAGARLRMGDILFAPSDVQLIGLEAPTASTSTSTSTTTP